MKLNFLNAILSLLRYFQLILNVVHSVFSGVKTNKKTISESQERRGERKEVTNLVTRWELSLGRKTKKNCRKRERKGQHSLTWSSQYIWNEHLILSSCFFLFLFFFCFVLFYFLISLCFILILLFCSLNYLSSFTTSLLLGNSSVFFCSFVFPQITFRLIWRF